MSVKSGNILDDLVPSVLNSYSVVFFFNSRFFGLILLVASFFNLIAGLSGLFAVVLTVFIARFMGFDESRIKQGIYSFNALLTGIGIGTFFEPGAVFIVLLLSAALFSLMLSVILGGWFGKYGLPFLSIPFVLSFWLVLLPSGQLLNLGLTQKNVFWMNEMYSIGGKPLLDFFQVIDNLPLNRIVIIYLRSLSSIIFQDNLVTGILIAIALVAASRIAFLLSVTGFLTAYLFAVLAGSDMAGFSFYNVGANYILVAIAAGGFFVIPSKTGFLWTVLLIPMTSMLILFLNRLMIVFGIPFFSLPFSVITIVYLYFLLLRVKPGKPVITPYQYYSPEVNLYSYSGNISRVMGYNYFPLQLPFWGEWNVSQGYNGIHTHKGEWGQALDFVLMDETGKTHGSSSNSCDDYYCYNKPVLAPADGTVVELTDDVDDNEPGKVDLTRNWGNTVILYHAPGLYTQLSHLRAGSFRVKKGDYVRKGDILGLCGNSGRSPEPHVHYQAQSTPVRGARTMSYPFSYYLLHKGENRELKCFTTPEEGERISNVLTGGLMTEAFGLQPGTILEFSYTINGGGERNARWEVFTDAWNARYIYCHSSKSTAWFVNDGTMFYFTTFHGNRESLLYSFYLSAYRILLGYHDDITVKDIIPLHNILPGNITRWLHDFAAPFRQTIKAIYSVSFSAADSQVNPDEVSISSVINVTGLLKASQKGSSIITIARGNINQFSFKYGSKTVWAQRINI